MSLAPGSRVGVYEIATVIGRGGMGEVYRARDTRLDRIVALKILPPDLARDGERRQRFEREARLTSSLNHPNIVVLYDIGESDGLHFIAMEHVEGDTLALKMRSGGMPVSMVTELASQIADGVASAHDAGVIHRDLKPSNIMVTGDRRVKVLDFGLGKAAQDEHPGTDVITEFRDMATTPGVLLGTAAFMSPEQAQGLPADARSDQFAIGLIIYQMLTGQHAFMRASTVQTLTAIIEDEPAPLHVRAPKTPEALALVVQRCLAKDPGGRFASTTDLARALQDIDTHLRSGRTLSPVSAPQRPLVKRVSAVAAAIILSVGLAAGWQFATRGASFDAKQIAVLPFSNVNGDAPNQALSDGLAEVLATRLTQLERFSGGLQVVPASDVRQQQVTSARDARRVFGVNLVVSGSLQRSADRLRLTLNVIDAETLRQLRADTIEVPMQDASAMQDEVLLRLTRLLDIDMTEQARAAVSVGGTRAPGAVEYYLQGRGYLQRYEKTENVDAALSLFERSIALDPNYGLAHAALAEACWRKYDITKDSTWSARAQASGAAALRLSPSLAQVRITLGMLAVGTGRYEDAVKELNAALSQDPTSADAYRELGRAYEALGDAERAETTFKAAVAARTSDWSVYNALGAFYARHGRPADAALQFERVVALTPDNARGYTNLGSMYGQQKDWARAFPALEKATVLNPNDRTFSNLATAYFLQGRFDQAAAAYDRAIALGAKSHQVWFNFASALRWVPGNEARAREAYQHAVELGEAERRVNPRQAQLIARLANCYANLGEPAKARALIGEAEALAPKDPRVWLLSAQVFEQLGERSKAITKTTAAVGAGLSKDDLESTRSLEALRKDPAYAAISQ